ncbi:MAG: hypothetical protein ACI9MR_003405, partial [Myxococcota bacterium]
TYRALVALLQSVGDAYKETQTNPDAPFILDFEYKLMRTDAGPKLVVKQVRPLPVPDRITERPAFLLPSAEPLERCTFQGEYNDVFDAHRGKVRLRLDNDASWLDVSRLTDSFYDDVSFSIVVDDGPVTTTGAPSTWAEPTFELTNFSVDDHWGSLADGGRRYTLQTGIPRFVTGLDAPVKFLSDAQMYLSIAYAEPVFWIDYTNMSSTRMTDSVRLADCPEDTVITPQHVQVTRRGDAMMGGAAVAVETDFYYPPMPTGVIAGYTAPLAQWVETRITGLTTDPITLTSYYAQTFRPGHHNFSEDFVFEPRLDPGLTDAQKAELVTANIRLIHLAAQPYQNTGAIKVLGFDGRLRELR